MKKSKARKEILRHRTKGCDALGLLNFVLNIENGKGVS